MKMKHMKPKVAVFLIVLCVLIALLPLNGKVASADSDIESLEPNSYEEKDCLSRNWKSKRKKISLELYS